MDLASARGNNQCKRLERVAEHFTRISTTIAVRFWKLPPRTCWCHFCRCFSYTLRSPFQPSSKHRLLGNARHFRPRNLSFVANRVFPWPTFSAYVSWDASCVRIAVVYVASFAEGRILRQFCTIRVNGTHFTLLFPSIPLFLFFGTLYSWKAWDTQRLVKLRIN